MTQCPALVSVCMITYNHEKFISQAIESVIMQKTSFPIELIIGEDCSTDRTREICLEYQQKYPDIIKLNLPLKNRGAQQNFLDTYALCTGKYIALCEGDDYWNDLDKLQKQVGFLEGNPDFSMSSHHSLILGHNRKLFNDAPLTQLVYTTKDIICLDWNIMTASIVFRKKDFIIPGWFLDVKNGDYALQLMLSTKGLIGYIPEGMSVYRRHIGGVSAGFNPFYSVNLLYSLFKHFDEETNFKYKKDINKKLRKIYRNNINAAHQANLRRQALAISIVYCFSKIGVDILPQISKMSFFQKK